MSINNAIYALSNMNAALGSMVGYNDDKAKGLSTADAVSNLGWNLMNGVLRNEASREIAAHTGSYLGYAVNSAAGYGNAEANAKGSAGTIMAAQLSSPFGIFGGYTCMTPPMFYTSPFVYNSPVFMGGGFFGGGCGCHVHNHHRPMKSHGFFFWG